jgi:Holliday junction resolvase RusA-like endonuclease
VLLLDITIPGDPISKGRPRSGNGRTYTPQRTRDAEQRIRDLIEYSPWRRRVPYEGPVSITIHFWCATRRHTDGDNLQKLIWDAIQRGKHETGGIIKNDAQIETWHCRLWRAAPGEEPRTTIVVTTLVD